MEPVSESLRLLNQKAEIEFQCACRMPSLKERDLFAIRARLTNFLAAVRAIAERARARHQSVEQICAEDVEHWVNRG
jgi:hypothetical protein